MGARVHRWPGLGQKEHYYHHRHYRGEGSGGGGDCHHRCRIACGRRRRVRHYGYLGGRAHHGQPLNNDHGEAHDDHGEAHDDHGGAPNHGETDDDYSETDDDYGEANDDHGGAPNHGETDDDYREADDDYGETDDDYGETDDHRPPADYCRTDHCRPDDGAPRHAGAGAGQRRELPGLADRGVRHLYFAVAL